MAYVKKLFAISWHMGYKKIEEEEEMIAFKAYRKIMGLSINDLGYELGIPVRSIYRYLSGAPMSIARAMMMEERTGIPRDAFIWTKEWDLEEDQWKAMMEKS